jgi:hypothetical protein
MIERHGSAPDFFEAEKDYYSTYEHRRFLVNHIIAHTLNSYIALEFMYPQKTAEQLMHETELPEMMGQHYFLQNRSLRWLRITILWSYVFGFIFLAIPAVITFGQVLYRGVGTRFGI